MGRGGATELCGRAAAGLEACLAEEEAASITCASHAAIDTKELRALDAVQR